MQQILFASDFSKASRKAFAAAVNTAKRAHAALSIAHVLAAFVPIGPDQYMGSETWKEIEDQARQWAQKHLDALAKKARRAGVRTRVVLVEGIPAREIPRLARRAHADLLVIGTHGRTGFSKLLLGSVAGKVVAMATCPVMTVRGQR
jgi:universal stress protein A